MTLSFPHTIVRRTAVLFESNMPAHGIRMIKMSAALDTDKDQK
jgi:hypothetical protein